MTAKAKLKKIKCAARDCDVVFKPRIFTQKFCSRKCNDRESQRIYRERHQQQQTIEATA